MSALLALTSLALLLACGSWIRRSLWPPLRGAYIALRDAPGLLKPDLVRLSLMQTRLQEEGQRSRQHLVDLLEQTRTLITQDSAMNQSILTAILLELQQLRERPPVDYQVGAFAPTDELAAAQEQAMRLSPDGMLDPQRVDQILSSSRPSGRSASPSARRRWTPGGNYFGKR